MPFVAKFWGVRGSVPSPLTPEQVRQKVREGILRSKEGQEIPFEVESTYGGNTTCVEVNCGDHLFILDMGTGVRELGNAQMGEIMKSKKLHGTILQSHVHWDHIQGLPFWKPLYLPRRMFDCKFDFYGGKQWDSQLDLVYRGQMNPPVFPVDLQELEQTSMNMTFKPIFDGWTAEFSDGKGVPGVTPNGKIKVLARKLFHPQETFGYRIEYGGKALAFTTDHEPYAGGLPKPLLELVHRADVWITDCQYSHDEYLGTAGPQKMGWGHSYPEYIGQVAHEAKPKMVLTTHHDPEASDWHITELADQVESEGKIDTKAAYEGLRYDLDA